MSWISTPGMIFPHDNPPQQGAAPSFATNLVIDATGEKISFGGSLWIPDGQAKSITRVGFRWGAVTKAGGSALTLSLQDLNTSGGFPTEPDESQDQTVAVANADAGFVSNTWYRSGALDSSRSVSPGDMFALVVEFDGAGRLGADSVVVSSWTAVASSPGPGISLKTGGTWAAIGNMQNLVFEFTDGTFGCFFGHNLVGETFTAATFNSGSGTTDERAMEFEVPFPMKVCGAWASVAAAGATSDFEIILYQGTTALQTIVVNADYLVSTAQRPVRLMFPSETTLVPGVTYYLAIRPTTANNITTVSYTVNDAAHISQLWPFGSNVRFNGRLNQGAWNLQLSTARLSCGLYVSAILQGDPASRAYVGM